MTLHISININYTVNSYLISLLKLKEHSLIKKTHDSNNKIKTMWNIVNSESGRNNKEKDILKINIDGKVTNNHKIISNSLNTYFLTIADTVREETQNITNS
jgi:hypothetical protein